MKQLCGGWFCGTCGQENPSAQLYRTQAQALSARCTRRVRASARLLRRSAARAPHRRAVAAAAQRAAPPRPPCSGHVDSCTPRPRYRDARRGRQPRPRGRSHLLARRRAQARSERHGARDYERSSDRPPAMTWTPPLEPPKLEGLQTGPARPTPSRGGAHPPGCATAAEGGKGAEGGLRADGYPPPLCRNDPPGRASKRLAMCQIYTVRPYCLPLPSPPRSTVPSTGQPTSLHSPPCSNRRDRSQACLSERVTWQ